MKFKTMPLATKYCVGSGIEIGAAAHNPFDLPDCKFVATCDGVNALYPQDLQDFRLYRQEQLRLNDQVNRVDHLGDFQKLDFAECTQDYIVSSHVIEHIPNLIAALVESYRVLKNGGTFVCLFPKRNAEPTDAVRPLTTLESMIDAYERGVTPVDLPHLPWRTHYLVFSLQSMVRVVNYINGHQLGNWLIECVEQTDSKVGNGHTIILRKLANLPEMQWTDVSLFNGIVNKLIENGEYSPALTMIKAALSFDFFDPKQLYIAALLSARLNNRHEGIEFLRQSLIIDPENEQYRREFIALAGTHYSNPVL